LFYALLLFFCLMWEVWFSTFGWQDSFRIYCTESEHEVAAGRLRLQPQRSPLVHAVTLAKCSPLKPEPQERVQVAESISRLCDMENAIGSQIQILSHSMQERDPHESLKVPSVTDRKGRSVLASEKFGVASGIYVVS